MIVKLLRNRNQVVLVFYSPNRTEVELYADPPPVHRHWPGCSILSDSKYCAIYWLPGIVIDLASDLHLDPWSKVIAKEWCTSWCRMALCSEIDGCHQDVSPVKVWSLPWGLIHWEWHADGTLFGSCVPSERDLLVFDAHNAVENLADKSFSGVEEFHGNNTISPGNQITGQNVVLEDLEGNGGSQMTRTA